MRKGLLSFAFSWESVVQTICDETESSHCQRPWRQQLGRQSENLRNKSEEHSFQFAGRMKIHSASIFRTLNLISVELLVCQSLHVHWDHFTPWSLEKWEKFQYVQVAKRSHQPTKWIQQHVKHCEFNGTTCWTKKFLGISFARAVENAKNKKIILT